jgi:hypothetical protein
MLDGKLKEKQKLTDGTISKSNIKGKINTPNKLVLDPLIS